MYVSKTPAVVKALYSSLVWNMSRQNNSIYLTFDDGPHPQITPQVLTHLNAFNSKASFFCIGKNISANTTLFEELKKNNHAVGNHTYNHENGWKTNNFSYYKSLMQCQALTQSNLFRPPYGKITKQQAKTIQPKFKIIMWDVLSGDFDKTISKEKCLDNVIKNILPGSIVVFHDSEKAAEKMLFALPKVLEYAQTKNYTCSTLSE